MKSLQIFRIALQAEGSTVRVAQADTSVTDEFGRQVVYIDYGRAMIKA